MSRLDQYYRSLMVSSIYRRGWGSYETLSKIVHYRRNVVSKRDVCLKFISDDHRVKIDKEYNFSDHTVLEGSFITPFYHKVPDLIPAASRDAKFQLMIPKKWWSHRTKPVVIHYAGTGDQYFTRRRVLIAKPLLTENSVASLLIENPFYGLRRPKDQIRSNLNHVQDIFIMGACLITESLVLMRWCESMGFGPFVLTGFSMGGYMASLSSTVWPKPLVLVPCLSWTTASSVFTRGVIAKAINWKVLEEQFKSDKRYMILREELKEIRRTEDLKRDTSRQLYCSFSSDEFPRLVNYNTAKNGRLPASREVLEFMHLLMDECTHMLNFDMPYDPSLIHVLSGKDDCYVLRDGVNDIRTVWPGSHVEFIDQGHVSAFLFCQDKFRKTIMNSLTKMIQKYNY